MVLFGSRARGDERPDSGYDVAVFFKALPNRRTEQHRLADLRVDLIDETGAFIDAKPFSIASYGEHTALMQESRRNGVYIGRRRQRVLSNRLIA